MGFELKWDKENIEHAKEDYNTHVAESLKKALKKTEKHIQFKKSVESLSARFHRTFTIENLHIAEISFSAQSASYRAICFILEKEKAVIYHTTVPKKGSKQERRIKLIRENSEKIKELIQSQVSADSS